MAYQLPDLYKPALVERPWEAGVFTGVKTSILAAAALRPDAGFDPTVSIPGWTAKVSGVITETTATTTNGSDQITVADASGWAVGHGISLGAVAKLIVTGGASASGTLTIKLAEWEYPVDVLAGDNAQTVASKIASMVWRGDTAAPVDNGDGTWTVRFRARCRVIHPDSWATRAASTGVTFAAIGYGGVPGVQMEYDGQLLEVEAVSGTTLTLSANVTASWTGLRVMHDDGPAFQAAIAAMPPNTALNFPPNLVCRSETGGIGTSRSFITIKCNGLKINLWGATGGVGIAPAGGFTAVTTQTKITGGKTKESSTLEVVSSTGYSVGAMCFLYLGHDLTLPVIGMGPSGVFDERQDTSLRKMVVKITAIPDSTHITIDPPLPEDFSGVICYAMNPLATVQQTGIEDLHIDGADNRSGNLGGYAQCDSCWVHNIRSSNGRNYMPGFAASWRSQMRSCFYDRMAGGGTNKQGLNVADSTGILCEDCISYGMAPLVEINGTTMWCAFVGCTFIYSEEYGVGGAGADFNIHTAHTSYNYVGHCWINGAFILDGYFGSASHWTLWRNHFDGTNGHTLGDTNPVAAIALKRFTRHTVIAGNQMLASLYASDWTNRGWRFGYPNIGNWDYIGTSSNNDWPMLARTLAAPITGGSLAAGVFTSPVDVFVPGVAPAGDGPHEFDFASGAWVFASNKYKFRITSVIDARNVTVEAIEPPPYDNPTTLTGVSFTIWGNKSHYQELDLEVEATTKLIANTSAFDGMPEEEEDELGGEDLPDCLCYAGKPQWWLDAETEFGTTFAWPPFGPRPGNLLFRNESISAIPSGYRFALEIPPRLSGLLIPGAGNVLKVQFNKPVSFGSGGNGGLTITFGAGPVTATYVSGAGTSELTFSLSRLVLEAEVEQPKGNYTNPGLGWVDSNGNEVEDFANVTINNSSTQTGSVTEMLACLLEDTDADLADSASAARFQIVNVSAPGEANKLRFYIAGAASQPPYNGPRVALWSLSGNIATLLRESTLNYTGTNRWCSADIEPIHLAAGNYLVGIRNTGSGPIMRTKTGGTLIEQSAINDIYYWAHFTTWDITQYAGPLSKTLCCGIRMVLDVDPPAAATGLVATAFSQTQINLTWTDESDDETGFKVEMAVGAGAFAVIHTTAANVQSYSVTGLTAGETYRFRIKATNVGGDSTPSNEDEDTTPPIVPPTTPTTSVLGFTLTPSVGDLHTRGLTRWRYNGKGWVRA